MDGESREAKIPYLKDKFLMRGARCEVPKARQRQVLCLEDILIAAEETERLTLLKRLVGEGKFERKDCRWWGFCGTLSRDHGRSRRETRLQSKWESSNMKSRVSKHVAILRMTSQVMRRQDSSGGATCFGRTVPSTIRRHCLE